MTFWTLTYGMSTDAQLHTEGRPLLDRNEIPVQRMFYGMGMTYRERLTALERVRGQTFLQRWSGRSAELRDLARRDGLTAPDV